LKFEIAWYFLQVTEKSQASQHSKHESDNTSYNTLWAMETFVEAPWRMVICRAVPGKITSEFPFIVPSDLCVARLVILGMIHIPQVGTKKADQTEALLVVLIG